MTNKVTEALVEYNKEISPLARRIEKLKEQLKDFKETDERAIELAEDVKASRDTLNAYLDNHDDYKVIKEEIAELEKEFKTAVKAAARATKDSQRPLKAGDLTPYFKARSKIVMQGKPTPVKKTIDKGDTFNYLEDQIKTAEV